MEMRRYNLVTKAALLPSAIVSLTYYSQGNDLLIQAMKLSFIEDVACSVQDESEVRQFSTEKNKDCFPSGTYIELPLK